MQQIADWLGKLGLSEYAQRFVENDIDFTILGDLTSRPRKDWYCRPSPQAVACDCQSRNHREERTRGRRSGTCHTAAVGYRRAPSSHRHI